MNDVDKYKEQRPLYESFAQSLKVLLKSILEAKNIKFHLIESRAKELDSFKNKIEIKGGKYADPLREILDLCGIRVIVFYQTDIDKIDKLIRDNFEVDLLNSIDKSTILKSNEFGYLSNHYIVKINATRANLPEWSKFKDLNAEIQLRTVLQHSWAAISHELEYKSKIDIPEVLKRKLFRLAGLFELADEEFVQVKQRQSELTSAIEKKTEYENTLVHNEVNLDTIKFYFEQNTAIVGKYWELGKNAGFEDDEFEEDDGFVYIENDQTKLHLEYSSIIRLCKLLKINTIESLNNLLQNNANELSGEYLRFLFLGQTPEKDGERRWLADGMFMIDLVLMGQLENNDLNNYAPKEWSFDILERVKKSIINWREKENNNED